MKNKKSILVVSILLIILAFFLWLFIEPIRKNTEKEVVSVPSHVKEWGENIDPVNYCEGCPKDAKL